MVPMLQRSNFEQVMYETLPVRGVDPDADGLGPTILGTTDESSLNQCTCNPVWNELMVGAVVEGLYNLLSIQCVLRLVEHPDLFWHAVFRY